MGKRFIIEEVEDNSNFIHCFWLVAIAVAIIALAKIYG